MSSSTRKKQSNQPVQQLLDQSHSINKLDHNTNTNTNNTNNVDNNNNNNNNNNNSSSNKNPTVINGIKLANEPDPTKITRVNANDGKTGEPIEVSFTGYRPVGNGSFGVVFQAKLLDTNETVAIKKVLQDKRFKNRELQIMRLTNHPNVCSLKSYFYSNGDKKDEVFLNLMLEYIPETIYRASRHFAKNSQLMPLSTVKLYMYQMFRSLAYIHALGICHRDIKPQNLLLDPSTGIMKLCDFGSAKILIPNEPNVSYICSRYYRAPELIFGATDYTVAIDVWSTGCVMAELLLGRPIFPGESGVDQLVEIVKILGTPTKEQIKSMNRNYTEYKFPQIKTTPWSRVFSKNKQITSDCLDFLSKLLDYTPTSRLTAIEALVHPFFDELRDPETKMNNGEPLTGLFNFSELELSIRPDLISKLVPKHAEAELYSRGIDIHNFKPIQIQRPSINE